MKNEIKALTGLRGIAAVYVAIGHIILNYASSIKYNGWKRTSLPQELLDNFSRHGYLAVVVFFVLSAFVLTLSNRFVFSTGVTTENFKIFMVKRVVRIFPIYIVNITAFYILFRNDFSIPQLIINYSLLHTFWDDSFYINPVSWSLSAEWIAYLIFPFMCFYLINIKPKYYRIIYVIVSILFICLLIQKKMPSNLFHLFLCFDCYIIGILCFQVYSSNEKLIKWSSNNIIIISLLLISLLFVKSSEVLYFILTPLLILGILKTNLISRFLSTKPIVF